MLHGYLQFYGAMEVKNQLREKPHSLDSEEKLWVETLFRERWEGTHPPTINAIEKVIKPSAIESYLVEKWLLKEKRGKAPQELHVF